MEAATDLSGLVTFFFIGLTWGTAGFFIGRKVGHDNRLRAERIVAAEEEAKKQALHERERLRAYAVMAGVHEDPHWTNDQFAEAIRRTVSKMRSRARDPFPEPPRS